MAAASEAERKHGKQQLADEALPAKRQKVSKTTREAAADSLRGGRANGSSADNMPGIPSSGAAEMTWKQLDKRTDVKRGRFSDREKETLLLAIKVRSEVISISQHPRSPSVATVPHPIN